MFPFGAIFREVAARETRVLTTLNDPRLGSESYALVEVYCIEPDCDCRRLLINVVRDRDRKPLATVNWAFDPGAPGRGPFLDPLNPQSDLSPALLDLVGRHLASDRAYVARLERHYRMVKEAVRDPAHEVHRVLRESRRPEPKGPSRNAPCPCGSGKKYKRCCGKNADPGRSKDTEAFVRERLKEFEHPKYADRPPGDFAERLSRDFPDAGAALARLAAYEPEGPVQRNARTLLFVACHEPGIDPAVREAVSRSAAPVLRAAMKDAAIHDDRKYEVGPLLETCGVKLSDKEYRDSFRDFEGTDKRKGAEHMKELSADLEFLESFLEESGLVSTDEPIRPSKRDFGYALGFAAELSEHNPEAGVPLLLVIAAIAAEHKKVLADAERALDVACLRGGGRAAWGLAELGAWPGLGDLGKKAAALAQELRAEGVAPSFPYPGTFSHARVTNVDGAGSRNLLVFFRTSDGEMDALVLMPNDEAGIKDVWCVFGTGARFEEDYLKSKDSSVRTAPVSKEIALEILGEALSTHAERNTPPPGRFLLYRPMLGPEPIPVRKRRPNLGAYALELLARSPELAADSEGLAEDPVWGAHWCATDEAYEFVRRNVQGKKHRAGASWIGAELLERFIREVAVRDRDRLLRRMAVNLEAEAWAGRAAEPPNRLAARTWLVLSEELLPFAEVPFVRALARRSLDNVSASVSIGFRSQREANEAAMP
jgi:hypothetical protein